MVMLVSLQQASDQVRRDTTDDDLDLILKIKAASLAVLNYITDTSFLNSSGEPDQDSAGDPINVPEPIQLAVLYLVGNMYSDRYGEEFMTSQTGEQKRTGNIILPRIVHFLLDPYKRPLC